MGLVVFLGKSLKHAVIIDCNFRQAVPIQKQEIAVPINDNGFCTFAVLQHSLERLIHFVAHGNLSDAAFRLGDFNIVANL